MDAKGLRLTRFGVIAPLSYSAPYVFLNFVRVGIGGNVKLVRFSYAAPLIALLAVACSASTGQNGKDGNSGANGGNGEDGQPGEAGKKTAAINLVEPRVGLVARQMEVMVSVDGKIDVTKAKLDFGAGVKVLQTGKIGNSLGAVIEISPQAKLGKHDVTITLGGSGEKLIAKGGFMVAVPLDAKISGGKAEQGGLVRLDIQNRDKNLWFDTENFRLFPLAQQGEGTLIPLSHQRFTLTDGTVVLLGDPLAKTGKMGFLGVNNPDDEDSIPFLTESDVVDVAARSPIALTAGTPIDKTFANELETAFYTADINPAAGQGLLVEALAAVPSDSNAQPLLLAYPQSGRVSDLVGQGLKSEGNPLFGEPPSEAQILYPVTEATKAFYIVLDAANGHGPSTKMSLNYATTPALIINEKGEHGTPETAQNLGSLPGFQANVVGRIVKGELLTADEVDIYKFSGLSANNATDMQVSVISDADVLVTVDTVPTFDSEGALVIQQAGKAGSGATLNLSGPDRFIKVTALPDSKVQTGKYTLGMKRVAPIITQNNVITNNRNH